MQCICAVNWSILLHNGVFTYRWSVAVDAIATLQRYVNTPLYNNILQLTAQMHCISYFRFKTDKCCNF